MENKNISATEAASRLGISVDEVEKLAGLNILHPTVSEDKIIAYSAAQIANIKSSRGTSLAAEAAKIGIQIQRETISSLSFVRKLVLAAGAGILVFLFLVGVFTLLFSFRPLQTAKWLGLTSKTQKDLSSQPVNQVKGAYVLAAQTSPLPLRQPSLLQTVLSPVRAVSLGIVKYANPNAYAQVAKKTILDTNDILAVDDGAITPAVPLKIPSSSSLQIADPGLIANLNSEFLQGKKPGTNVGDIAIIGPNGLISGLASPVQPASGVTLIIRETISSASSLASNGKTLTLNNSLTLAGTDSTTLTFQGSDTYVGRATTDTLTNKTLAASSNIISGLANANLNGAAGITNANLANPALTISTTSPLNGGGLVSLGNTLSLACPTCLISGDNLLTLAASSGLNSSISQGGTLTLAAGLNITTANNAAGTITLATSATPSFSTINGLVLAAAADGFTIAGGTTFRTATISGADITIGSIIKPTSAGLLSITSSGANILTLDTGGLSGIQIGNTNASNLIIGRSGVTTSINGLVAANNLTVGGGTTILKHLSATTTFDAANFSNCSTLGMVTVTGATVGDTALATPTPTTNGVETFNISWNAYVSSADVVTIRGCAVSNNENPANQTWRVDVWQH